LNGNTGRFVALLATLVLASLPFTFAPEFLILTTGEMAAPRKNLPKAARRYIYRILFFYILSALAIGVICPSNSPALTSGGEGAGASPFVVAIKNAGIPVLDSIINAGILLSAWSSGNSFFYMATRSLYSQAVVGNAPSWFLACTKSGVPYRCVMACALLCPLAYLNESNNSAVVFDWFINLTNESAFISWTCCCIVHLRFRKACKAQNITTDMLPYSSKLQPWGTYFGLFLFPFLALLNGFDVFFPENWSTSSFLTAYIGLPLFLVFYFGHRIYNWSDPWLIDPKSVDLSVGDVVEEAPSKQESQGEGKKQWWDILSFLWE
jgi:yeast amino acid transporter